MTRTIRDKPEPLSNHDLPRVRDALVVAVLALTRHGDTETLNQIEAIIEGKARLEKRPA